MYKSYPMVAIVEAKPMHISGVGEEFFLNRKRNGLFRHIWKNSDVLIEVVFKFQKWMNARKRNCFE